ncbi:tetratricopeptide repeat protein [Hymenobacter properus]|uniref:Tetratricopeptide repeat protein n=1 Tax=Hymenobacter properus TaxID=2791026 RepID=A0A931BEF9_9BACT|nr:tetratricopeptide repeat protein [Hymenobacter properus]MBF9142385.1 tetratricopeptide repeat protein [Hymenobacter properus]MBR7721192.1 tetratricopeptide repeat protein [Microvirga sp. SRT04]
MSPHFTLLVGLLAVLAWLLWRQYRPAPAPAAKPRRRANLPPISTGIDTVFALDEPAYRKFDARQWRGAVQLCLLRDGELPGLRLSHLFEKERPGDFNDGDRAFQAALQENINKLKLNIAQYTARIAQSASDAVAYNNRGYVLLLLGEYKQAIPDFDQAIALRATEVYAFAHNNRGFAYLRTGRPQKALADIEHSLLLDPDNSYAHRNLGIYYYEQGQLEAALAALELAATLNAETPRLNAYLRLVRNALAPKDPAA